jgi:hypothetical protein
MSVTVELVEFGFEKISVASATRHLHMEINLILSAALRSCGEVVKQLLRPKNRPRMGACIITDAGSIPAPICEN